MDVSEIIRRVRAAHPDLGSLSDEAAAKCLRAAFEVIRGDLRKSELGPLRVRGFGTFVVRMAQSKTGGAPRKVIRFRMPEADGAD